MKKMTDLDRAKNTGEFASVGIMVPSFPLYKRAIQSLRAYMISIAVKEDDAIYVHVS